MPRRLGKSRKGTLTAAHDGGIIELSILQKKANQKTEGRGVQAQYYSQGTFAIACCSRIILEEVKEALSALGAVK